MFFFFSIVLFDFFQFLHLFFSYSFFLLQKQVNFGKGLCVRADREKERVGIECWIDRIIGVNIDTKNKIK